MIETRNPRYILLLIAHFLPTDKRVLRTGMNSLVLRATSYLPPKIQ